MQGRVRGLLWFSGRLSQKKNSHMRNRPFQNVDFELVYCACVEKFVTSNLKSFQVACHKVKTAV